MISIVIPYRDRQEHLQAYLETARTLFASLEPYEIIVVHQQDRQLFNKGALMNAGVKEARGDYIILQDVDTIPRLAVLPLYQKRLGEREILSLYSAPNTLGGVVKMRRKTFCAIGGFPNNFWGWGGEDIMLLHRAKHAGCTIGTRLRSDQPENELAQFFDLRRDNHVREKRNYSKHYQKAVVEWDRLSDEKQRMAIIRDGTIDSLEHTVISKIRMPVNAPFQSVVHALRAQSPAGKTSEGGLVVINMHTHATSTISDH